MAMIEGEVLPLEDPQADYEKVKLELQEKSQANKGNAAELSSGEVELLTYVANRTQPFLYMVDSHFWDGSSITNIPNLPSWHYAGPRQKGTQPEGVRWGVVYATGTTSVDRKWVVAFDSANRKAYAEAGPYGEVDWNVVEVKLGLSGSKSEYVDPALGGKAVAEFNDDLPNTAHGYFYN